MRTRFSKRSGRRSAAGERDLWQGLAQIAVGLTHAMRGNTVGATKLLRRGAGRVANYTGDAHGIDTVGVLAWAEAEPAATAERRALTLASCVLSDADGLKSTLAEPSDGRRRRAER